jgi:hypothetical protein
MPDDKVCSEATVLSSLFYSITTSENITKARTWQSLAVVFGCTLEYSTKAIQGQGTLTLK